MPKPKLTEKQRRFVLAYIGEARGNGTEACRIAGYKGNDKTLSVVATENLGKPSIAEAIQESRDNDPLIATVEQVRKFWTETMNDDDNEKRDRLKASELLAKTQGQFIEKRIVHNTGDPQVVKIDPKQERRLLQSIVKQADLVDAIDAALDDFEDEK
jgi:phage terminase small subunit